MSVLSVDTDWERHRAFFAVMREGSLSGASRRLGIALPTIRRRIEALETEIGTPLFTRAPNGLLPTDKARALMTHAEGMALAAEAFVRAASADGDAVAGTVRISASEVMAIEILPPILADLLDNHPRLDIEISATNRNEDVLRREADIAVRMAQPQQEALVAQHIGAIHLGLHAHPDYLARHGTPQTLDALVEHRKIGVESDSDFVRLLRQSGLPFRNEDCRLRSDQDLAHLAAIRAGVGVGICQVGLGHRGGLVRLFPDQFDYPMRTWVVCHEDMRTDARIRAVFDALVAGLRAYAASA